MSDNNRKFRLEHPEAFRVICIMAMFFLSMVLIAVSS